MPDAGAPVVIATAGWSIPAAVADRFAGEGTHLQRYARVLGGVEINSSFHRPHRLTTFERWAGAVPPGFRFSVKLPKTITHGQRLVEVDALLDAFFAQVAGLGETLGVVLVQLPPSLAFDAAVAGDFFTRLAERTGAGVACEPRHASWFGEEGDALLVEHRVARVAAHPVLVPGGALPGGWGGLHYHRLHGAPRVYYSSYDEAFLEERAQLLCDSAAAERWCVFDNTASGAATADALALRSMIAG